MDWIDVQKTQPLYGQHIWAKHPSGKSIEGYASNCHSDIGTWALEDIKGNFVMYLTKWSSFDVIY